MSVRKNLIALTPSPAVLKRDVLPLDPAAFPKSLAKGLSPGGGSGSGAEEAYLVHACLLCLAAEWRGEEAADQGADECPPINH